MKRVIKEHTIFDDNFGDDIIILDLGACMGEFSEEMNNLYNVKTSILVEASPHNFEKIQQRDNFTLYNRVISSNEDDENIFYVDRNSPYNGSAIFNYFGGIETKINSITIPELFAIHNLNKVDVLKIDIEGSEYDILQKLDDVFFEKIQQITVEFHDFLDSSKSEITESIIRRMKKLGYHVITSPYPDSRNIPHYDVCFLK